MILLDTCVLYWLASDHAKLSARARDALRIHAASLSACAISAFEVAINHRKRRVVLPSEPRIFFADLLARYAIDCLPVTWEIAARSVDLPPIHSDPADRLIVATSQVHSLTIITPDAYIRAYPGVSVLW